VSTREGTTVSSSLIRRLLPLSLALFAVGTDGFVIAGLLPAIARDLGVDIPAAGQLVTAFALAFAVSAPVLGAATSALDRRTTMLIGLAGFSVGNALTALGPTYPVVLGARVFSALGAGLIGAAAFSTAAAIAPPERQGRALATVMGGLSISMALGLPAGTLIGSADWRVTLWAVTAIGIVAAAGVAFGVPVVSLPSTSLRARLRPLRETSVLGILAVTLLALAGTHVLYTYIGPVLESATGGSSTALTVVLLAWGVGNVAGNALGGALSDRYAPKQVVFAGLVAATLLLAAGPLAAGGFGAAVVWAIAWGVFVSMPIVPQQHRLVASAPEATPVLLGLNNSAIYAGVAAGGALGGILQHWLPAVLLGLAGAVISAAGALLTLTTAVPRRSRNSTAAAASSPDRAWPISRP
jgi:MFS transporter, DHA1 family, inner membrane transport protein